MTVSLHTSGGIGAKVTEAPDPDYFFP